MSAVDKSIYLEDANGTVYLAEPAGAGHAPPKPASCRCTAEVCFEEECEHCHALDSEWPCPMDADQRSGVYYEDEERPAGAVPLYRLTEQSESTPAIAPPTGGSAAAGGGAIGATDAAAARNRRRALAAASPETDNRPGTLTPRAAEGAAVTARKQGTS